MTKNEKLIEEINKAGLDSKSDNLSGTLKAWSWASKQASKDSDYF